MAATSDQAQQLLNFVAGEWRPSGAGAFQDVVNPATAEVLAAVVDGLDLDSARAIVARRERTTYRAVSDFTSQLPGTASTANGTLTVGSDYFVANVRVTIGGAQARGIALLQRGPQGWPAILWRKVS